MRLLPPVLAVGQRPPKDIHKLLAALGAALDAGQGVLVAAGAVDGLLARGDELGEGD